MKTTISKVAKIAGMSAVAGMAAIGAVTITLNVIDQVKQRGKNSYERTFDDLMDARKKHYAASVKVCEAIKDKIDEGNAMIIAPIFNLNRKMDNMYILSKIDENYEEDDEFERFINYAKDLLHIIHYEGPIIIQTAHGHILLGDIDEWNAYDILNEVSKKRIEERKEFLRNLYNGRIVAEECVAGADSTESSNEETSDINNEPQSGEFYPGEFDET